MTVRLMMVLIWASAAWGQTTGGRGCKAVPYTDGTRWECCAEEGSCRSYSTSFNGEALERLYCANALCTEMRPASVTLSGVVEIDGYVYQASDLRKTLNWWIRTRGQVLPLPLSTRPPVLLDLPDPAPPKKEGR